VCVRSSTPSPDPSTSNSICFATNETVTLTTGSSILFDGIVTQDAIFEVTNIRTLETGMTLEPVLVGPGGREPPTSLHEQQARPFWRSLDYELIMLQNVTVIDTSQDGEWNNNLVIVRGNWVVPGINSIGGITKLDDGSTSLAALLAHTLTMGHRHKLGDIRCSRLR
jgi:hypothetical protein